MQCALTILGVRKGQQSLAKLIGITEDGADEQDILQAIAKLGLRPDELSTDSRQEARRWLIERSPLHPSLLCVDDWGHWVTVAGMCHDRVFLFDPAKEVWNTKTRGAWPLKPETILKRWKASRKRRGPDPAYYAIGLLKVS